MAAGFRDMKGRLKGKRKHGIGTGKERQKGKTEREKRKRIFPSLFHLSPAS